MKNIIYGSTGTVSVQSVIQQLEKKGKVFHISLEDTYQFQSLISKLSELRQDDTEYTDLVIDSLDKLEMLLFKKIVGDYSAQVGSKVESIEHVDGGYGKGYVKAREKLADILHGIDHYIIGERKMRVWIVASSELTEFKNPFGISYHKFGIRANKHIASLLEVWASNIYFAAESGLFDPSTRVEGEIDIYTKSSIAYVAKNNGSVKSSKISLNELV